MATRPILEVLVEAAGTPWPDTSGTITDDLITGQRTGSF